MTTAKKLAETAPDVEASNLRRIIGIHGRHAAKIAFRMNQIIAENKDNEKNFVLKSFCYDLSDFNEVNQLVDDILETFPGATETDPGL